MKGRHAGLTLFPSTRISDVEKAMQHKIFENEEIKNIYTALGVKVGTEKIEQEHVGPPFTCPTRSRFLSEKTTLTVKYTSPQLPQHGRAHV